MSELLFRGQTLYSDRFNDIYYNPWHGLEESVHVFIKGCGLDVELSSLETANIAELGFGTGLNFVALLKFLGENSIRTGINYYSIEKFPLKKEKIRQVSRFFGKEVGYFRLFLSRYPNTPKRDVKMKVTDNVNLKILVGDARKRINEIPGYMDYWFLDGFSPSKNPEMWSKEVFDLILQKSKVGAKLSTFSSARVVKDGLKLANFDYARVKGFGDKRHMIKAEKKE
ncbi:tRNA (5-methylaminomethyl-2-thiouridine)(34)-methyltransferase MnmD [Borrelia sp. BU AG58]|uniref:tRNA (5-methylaminomethyl-2-thiouridine)(34)-methyltransferase MnmD n=1 Tax=Borrelia sp. BU AG58 TaxID=2887345 RepID=UPI001E3374FA|nr:tRNA (5-methylaminomethyl-2-thiouridine)(34)-methyltransferase MnmD [Borrelia sp. BU AG58]UER68041.1 tRNA (5-methylaminomethyl-2-thiouridine)(34)-methyltransferase MnmD [Borrelia sp. BU AG58]